MSSKAFPIQGTARCAMPRGAQDLTHARAEAATAQGTAQAPGSHGPITAWRRFDGWSIGEGKTPISLWFIGDISIVFMGLKKMKKTTNNWGGTTLQGSMAGWMDQIDHIDSESIHESSWIDEMISFRWLRYSMSMSDKNLCEFDSGRFMTHHGWSVVEPPL